jgi:anti-anti-sigma regulatory factor
MAQLRSRVQQGSEELKIALAGEICETSDLMPFVPKAKSVMRVVIDLAEINRLNSAGIREWLNFVRACNRAGARIELERCAPVVVAQLNAFRDFAGTEGLVRSVLAPYICESCGHEMRQLVDCTGGDVTLEEELPCPKCGQVLLFEDLVDVYLSFRSG